MTREEAIKILKILKRQTDGYYLKTTEALNIAIKVLEQKPILDEIRKIIEIWEIWKSDDNFSSECMIKIAELLESQESEV